MSYRLLIPLALILLGGFAYCMIQASAYSGTDKGNLWLLGGLVAGIGLIVAVLASLNSMVSRKRPPRDGNGPS